MSFSKAISRSQRRAALVALLALFAQLWLVQIGTGHLLRMAVAGVLPADVCSAQAPPQSTESESQGGTSQSGAFSCPVCVAAAATIAGGARWASTADAPEAVLRLSLAQPQPLVDLRQSGIRPPAQAPPQA